MPTLVLPGQSFHLDRYPARQDDPLRPWDAADEYLLKNLLAEGTSPASSVLIINDTCGALATALHAWEPTSWSDSYLSHLALGHNLAGNDLDPAGITLVPGDREPTGIFDLVLLRFPKSLAYLEDLLLRLRSHLHEGSTLLAGGMIKHTPARAFGLVADIIGPVITSLGWKKARLATATFASDLSLPGFLPECEFLLEEFGWTLTSRANVFSRDRLDQGTRRLLEHLPTGERYRQVADLGCGNGVLALALASRCPQATILGVDESYQAVASARDNVRRIDLSGRDITFAVADGLGETASGRFDLVVCNPPFHLGQATGDFTAWRMFKQGRRSLRKGGELRIVGNRHLGYHVKLKRLFGNCEVLGSDRKFVVLRALR